jgi:hypothetical protein
MRNKFEKPERDDESYGGLLEGIGPTTRELRFTALAAGAIRALLLALRARMRRNKT